MNTYALIVASRVVEVFEPVLDATGKEVAIEDRFHPDFVSELVLVPDGATVAVGDSYDGFTFGPPPPLPEPLPLTVEQAKAMRDVQMAEATLRIAPLQDAVDLGEATPDELAMLKKWKQHRVALNRIEQQVGFPTDVDWPVAPV